MKYYKTWCSTPLNDYLIETDKAIGLTMTDGSHQGKETDILWLPKSQLRFSMPNEYGNIQIFIPVWILKKNDINKNRLRFIKELDIYPDDIVEI